MDAPQRVCLDAREQHDDPRRVSIGAHEHRPAGRPPSRRRWHQPVPCADDSADHQRTVNASDGAVRYDQRADAYRCGRCTPGGPRHRVHSEASHAAPVRRAGRPTGLRRPNLGQIRSGNDWSNNRQRAHQRHRSHQRSTSNDGTDQQLQHGSTFGLRSGHGYFRDARDAIVHGE